MTGSDVRVEAVLKVLTSERIAFAYSASDELWPPHSSHDEHRYDFVCAICRVGDSNQALRAVIARTLELTN